MDQRIIDEAVRIATSYAMDNNPLERVIWVPPRSASDNPIGTFIVVGR